MTISTTFIKSIQDIMRQDAGVDGDAQRISQLSWLLFLKIFDDQETELEILRDSYKSPIPEHLRWRHWAANAEGMTGEELQDFINNTLFPKLKGLNADPLRNPRGYVVQQVASPSSLVVLFLSLFVAGFCAALCQWQSHRFRAQ